MTRDELQALIDRVIGKKGILRAPSYWVSRLLGNLMDYTDGKAKEGKAYTDDAVKNVKITVDSEMSDESENPVGNKVIKAYVDMHEGHMYNNIVTLYDNTKYVVSVNINSRIYVTVDEDVAAKGYRAIIELTTPSNLFGLSFDLADSIKWANGIVPSFTPATQYVIYIVNGVAVCMAAIERAALDLSDIEDIDSPYFTIIAMDDNCEVQFRYHTGDNTRYAIGSGLWRQISQDETIIINAGQSIAIQSDSGGNFNVSKRFYATGSILSLSSVDDGSGILHRDDVYGLFEGSLVVGCSKDLFAGITQLKGGTVFYELFANCGFLEQAPNLPSCAIPSACCAYMFKNCRSLEIAPELPSTELGENCYASMFMNCSALRVAPKLPATTLAKGCYASMFNGCTSLRVAPELPATILVDNCYGVCEGSSGMFGQCTALTNSPRLVAETLAPSCYKEMFYGCSSLNDVTVLANDVSATDCMKFWLRGVSTTGIVSKLTGVNIQSGESGIPDGWTVYSYNAANIV